MGAFSGSPRTADQSELALFWQSKTPLTWNRVAAQISAERGLSFTANVRLFALLKRDHGRRRHRLLGFQIPLQLLEADYRDPRRSYPSRCRPDVGALAGLLQTRHSCLSRISLSPRLDKRLGSGHPRSFFGDNTSFTVISESRPGTRTFSSFSSAVLEIADARVFGGIHFRTSCVIGNTLGSNVANFTSTHAMRELDDNQNEQ